MQRLAKINVLFDHGQHTYTNTETGEMLQGVTSTLINYLYPNKYKGIPQAILANAANRGHMIHSATELYDTLGIEPASQEGKNYVRLITEHGLKHLASEYLVSDMKNFASSIDKVYEDGENVSIADIKTTSYFDKKSVSWQLSIYAYFFGLANPDIKISHLYGIWLKGDKAELIEVDRHSEEEVKRLIQCYLAKEPFADSDHMRINEQKLMMLNAMIKELTDELEAEKQEILNKMTENGEKSIDTGQIKVTLVGSSKRETFDSKLFKSENTEMYSKYIKITETKPTIKITYR